jgi:hypothetical protein
MGMAARTKRVIQVCGDPTVDWMIIEPQDFFGKPDFFAEHLGETTLSAQEGGVALTTMLLEAMYENVRAIEVEGVRLNRELYLTDPIANRVVNSLTIWEAYEEDDKLAYRIKNWVSCSEAKFDYKAHRLEGVPECLVIDDSALGFRGDYRGWPDALRRPQDISALRHIFLKIAKFDEPARLPTTLKRILKNRLADRTTIIASLADLRACEVRVGASLSWSSMLESVAAAVRSPATPFVGDDGKLRFERVVVTLGASGAVIVEKASDSHILSFDRFGQEGDWKRQREGDIMGYNTCMVASLVKACMDDPDEPDWATALERAMLAARLLHIQGYAVEEEDKRRSLRFPVRDIAKVMRQGKQSKMWRDSELSVFQITWDEMQPDKGWAILSQVMAKGGHAGENAIFQQARRVAREGPEKALKHIPVERIEEWRSADRMEIETVRSVSNSIRDYLKANPDKPLSIAVFGPPGSGKSFAIKQIVESFGGDRFTPLTFNLSQFRSPDDLSGAFHRVRDIVLRGKMPLVFWDEFDCALNGEHLGWLRYFLAPMQDGEFMDAGVAHPTGPGLYVFAGGTEADYESFCRMGSSDKERGECKRAKKPDFISRLKGYINIMGPNPKPNCVEDRHFMIRRAFLLNSLLHRHADHLFRDNTLRIDDGLLNAFLKVPRYKHGTRSMEALISMSSVAEKSKYELSSLPADEQLELHVDAEEFLKLTRVGHRDVLKIGITGHRFLMDVDKIKAGIQRALDTIETKFPDSFFAIFSLLAEGADRIVAEEIRERFGEGTRLIAVLPLPKDDYVTDFDPVDDTPEAQYESREVIREFEYYLDVATDVIEMPPTRTRNEAYEAAGQFVADNCDILIAVWDGKGAQGQGGTADIVYHARERQVPVCHIKAGNRKPGTNEPTTLGPEQGERVTYNF